MTTMVFADKLSVAKNSDAIGNGVNVDAEAMPEARLDMISWGKVDELYQLYSKSRVQYISKCHDIGMNIW